MNAKNVELDVMNVELRVVAYAKQEEAQQVSTAAKRKREVEEEKIQEVSTEKKRKREADHEKAQEVSSAETEVERVQELSSAEAEEERKRQAVEEERQRRIKLFNDFQEWRSLRRFGRESSASN